MDNGDRKAWQAITLPTLAGLLLVFWELATHFLWPATHDQYVPLTIVLTLLAFVGCCFIIFRLVRRLSGTEEQLQAIFKHSLEFIALIDASGRILRANQAALDFGECTMADLAGQVLWKTPFWLGDETTRQAVASAFAEAIQGGQARRQVLIRNRQGREVHLDFSFQAIPGPGGKIEWLVAEGRDIDELVAATQSLQKSESLFRQATQHSAIGMALNAPDGRWISVNPALCDMLGYTKEELLLTDFQSLTPEEGKARDQQELARVLAGDKVDFEKEFLRKDGERLPVRVCGSLIRDAGGAPEVIIAQFINIKARKEAEERLLRLRHELEERVAERTRDLWGANASLLGERQKMIVLKELAEESNRTSNLDDLLRHTLEAVARLTRWPVGQVWKREAADAVLATSDIRFTGNDPQYEQLLQTRKKIRFTDGNGLVGHTMQVGRPVWVHEIDHRENLIGYPELKDAGLHFAVTLPILVRGDVHAVLQFFSPTPGGGVDGEMQTFLTQLAELLQIIAERKVEEGEIRGLAMIVQHTMSAIVMADARGRIEWANPSFTRITGYTLNEVRGKKPGEVLQGPDSDKVAIARIRAGLAAGENVQEEVVNYTKSGEKYWASLVIQPVRDALGHINGFVAIQQDVTRRKLAEEALKQKDRELNALVRHLGDAVITMDQSGTIRSANLAAERLFGHEKLEGNRFDQLVPPEYRQKLQELLRTPLPVPDESHLIFNQEIEGLHQDGSHIPLEGTLTMYRVDEQVYFTALLHDIRQRKQVIAELTEARDAAQTANRAKSVFLAAMSHEIRTPLNGVVGMIDLLATQPLQSGQQEMVGTIKDSAFALLAIIDDILDFSKIEAGRLELDSAIVDIREVLEGVAETLAPIAQKKNILLTAFVDPAIPAGIVADGLRLRQILFNLAGNALKFTGQPGSLQGRVDVRVELIDGIHVEKPLRLCFSVRDNGIGIDEEGQKLLFKPFTQAESSTTRRFGGTGLGLSICKRLTELMSGTISVQSVKGEGSLFTVIIDFPAAEAAAPPAPLPDFSGIITLVPGEHPLLDDIARYLLAAGCPVYRLEDVAALDHHLQEMNGKKAAPAAHGRGAENTCPPIVILLAPEYQLPLCNQIGEQLQRLAPPVRVVLIGRGRRHYPRMADERSVIFDGPLLRRRTLLEAVAIAAGRQSPPLTETPPSPGSGFDERPPPPPLPEALASGQAILVAEDNEINQAVILRQLHRLGYAAEVVGDGQEALDCWVEHRHRLILADYHMPELDGIGLTESIRGIEAGNVQSGAGHTIIIAFTANAIKGECERMLAAGMDDFISKPVTLDQLAAKLDHWLPLRAAEPSTPTTIDPAACIPDLSVLAALVGDAPEVIAEFVAAFIGQTENHLAEIRDACAEKNAPTIAALAHKLKSSARTMGATLLATRLEELEREGKNEDWKRIRISLTEVQAIFTTVRQHLAALGY